MSRKRNDESLPGPALNTFPSRPTSDSTSATRSTLNAILQSKDAPASDITRADPPQGSDLAADEVASSIFSDSSDPSYELQQFQHEPEASTETHKDQRSPMSKAPLLIRSSPGFGTGSYGAAPVDSDIDEADGSDDDLAGLPNRAVAPSGHASVRRRKSSSTNRSDTLGWGSSSSLGHRRRRSEEIGGSSVMGGPEGRFGVTDTSGFSEVSEDRSDSSVLDDEQETDEDVSSPADEEDPPDNSPYAQVRASVSPTDNTTLSINTPRMWILSSLFAVLGSSTNLFFSLRYPSVAITPVIALLLVHPLGLIWDLLLKRQDDPVEEFFDGARVSVSAPHHGPGSTGNTRPRPPERISRAERLRLWLGQGTWNEKEHSCVYVSSNVSFGFAFATDVIVEQTQFYKQDASIVYQLLLTFSTQILGYAFAGLTRRFLVRPSGMIWPGTLMSAAMFTTLHKEENKIANGWRISRWKFFYIIWAAAFIFYFLPGLLMPALSYFNVVTWFAPDNVVVANLFGVASGLGLFPITFDWAQIAYIGSPLLTPFWAAMNVIGGLVVVMWIVAPIAYYGNLFYSSYMPILSASVFDNVGNVYDVSKILTPEFTFDREAYSHYSRVFLPITYVLSYGVQFAGLASLLTHTACWHGRDIWTQWRRSLKEAQQKNESDYQPLSTNRTGIFLIPRANNDPSASRRANSNSDDLMSREDVHNRLMRRYEDAPISWYLMTGLAMTAVGIFVVE
jgi:OPT family oligopeptide transporter